MRLETILTSRDGLGLESATAMQIGACRIIEGSPLGDLAGNAGVRRMLGCDPAELPDGQPDEYLHLAPVRCAKTQIDVANGMRLSQTVDVSGIKPGEEPPRGSILATTTDLAHAAFGHLVGAVRQSPIWRRLLVCEPTADTVTLRHPSGLPMPITVVASSRGGYSIASRWQFFVSFQEGPAWHTTDKVVSLEESRETALPRILPGGQIGISGSPWQPSGYPFDAFREHFGKPSRELVVLRASPAWEINPSHFTPERVERIKRTSPRTFKMHLLAEFGSAQNAALDFDDTIAGFRSLEAGYVAAEHVGLCDFSDLSSPHGDATVLLVASPMVPSGETRYQMVRHPGGVEVEARDELGYPIALPTPTKPLLRIHEVHSWQGRIPIDHVVAEQSRILKRYGARQAAGDQRSDTAVAALFRQNGIAYHSNHWTNESKHDAVQAIARALAARELSFCDAPKLREQLLAYGYKLLPGSRFQYQGRGPNDDHVAALMSGMMFLASPEALALSARAPRPLRGDPRRVHQGGKHIVAPGAGRSTFNR